MGQRGGLKTLLQCSFIAVQTTALQDIQMAEKPLTVSAVKNFNQLRCLGNSIDYTVCHRPQPQHAFPCGWGSCCLGFWSAAVFHIEKLEHIFLFRQNITVIVVLLCKASHLVLGGDDPFNAFYQDCFFFFLICCNDDDPTVKKCMNK